MGDADLPDSVNTGLFARTGLYVKDLQTDISGSLEKSEPGHSELIYSEIP